MRKTALAAMAVAIGAVGTPALASVPASVKIYAGYSNNIYDSTILRFVVSGSITNGVLTGIGTSGSGNGLTGTLAVGNLGTGTYDCVLNGGSCDDIGGGVSFATDGGAPFAFDYDDSFSGSATYTFTADGLGPYTFSPEANASGGFVAFLGNDQNGNELDQEVGFTLVAGVPEPATWALMIGGFGLTGAAMRRRVTAAA